MKVAKFLAYFTVMFVSVLVILGVNLLIQWAATMGYWWQISVCAFLLAFFGTGLLYLVNPAKIPSKR